MKHTRAPGWWRQSLAILAIVALAVALRLMAYDPWGQHHADEFYQYLEQANRLVTGYGLVPWETRFGIRSALIPQFLALPIWIGDQISPLGMLPIHLARLSFVALCLFALAGAWGIGVAKSRRHALVALFVAAVWYDSVQLSVLLLSESIATAAITCGAALLLIGNGHARKLKLAGLLLGLGCLLRFQYAPFVGVLVLASARLDRHVWRDLVLGGIVALAIGAVSDMAHGQAPLSWLLANLQMNIGEGRAAEFGQEGPLYYPRMIWLALGPAFPAIVAAALVSGRRYWPLMLAIAINLAVHMLIGHKEYRFIWLSVFLIVVMAAIGSVNVAEWIAARRWPGWKAGPLALLAVCAGWLGLSWAVAATAEQRLKIQGGAFAMAAHDVAKAPRVCGLAVPEDHTDHVIMAFLRRNVPIYRTPIDVADGLSSLPPELAAASNAALAAGDLPLNPEYAVVNCREHRGEKACLLVRPGGCEPAAGRDYDNQQVLLKTGM